MDSVHIKSNTDNYNFEQIDCFEKSFGIILDSYKEGYSNIFYMYMKLCKAYNIIGFNNIDEFLFIIGTIKKIINSKFGFNIGEKTIENNEYFEFINSKLDEDYRVVVPGNQKELFYSPYYKRDNFSHMFIIKGYDNKRQIYSILDNLHIDPNIAKYYDFFMEYETLKKVNRGYFNESNENGVIYYINHPNKQLKSSIHMLISCVTMYLDDMENEPYKEVEYINSILDEIIKYNNQEKQSAEISKSVNYKGRTFIVDEFINIMINTAKFKQVFFNELIGVATKWIEDKALLEEINILKDNIFNKWNLIINRAVINFYKCKVFDLNDLINEAIYYEELCKEKVSEVRTLLINKIDSENVEFTDGLEDNNEFNNITETEGKLVDIWKEVLGVEKINIQDDFFELGGHSLNAMKIIAQINLEFNVELPLIEVFKNTTIKELAKYIDGLEKSIYSSIKPAEKKEGYMLSSAQKRIYTMQQFDRTSINYNMPNILLIEGHINKNNLENALKKLIDRHESLRTSFHVIDGEIVQKIHENVEFTIEEIEIEEKDVKHNIQKFINPFDLSLAPLMRAELAKIDEKRSLFMIDMHHIISDGTSMNIFIEELTSLYEGNELVPIQIQYKDYSEWQNQLLQSEKMKEEEDYWINKFSGEIPKLDIPTDYKRPSVQSFDVDSIDFEIDSYLTKKLSNISKATGNTMHMILLAAYNILLSKYSGQEDIIVGTITAGRRHSSLQNVIGMFVNTLALRNYPQGEKTFIEFLEEVKITALQAYENEDYKFEDIVDKLDLKRDLSRNLLFDTMFILQNMGRDEVEIKDLKISPYDLKYDIAKIDLTMTAVEYEDKILINMAYCTDLFKEETIRKLFSYFINILMAIVDKKEIKLKEIDMLSKDEKNKVLVEFNNNKQDFPKDKTLQQLFEEQVERTPDKIAVECNSEKLTYRQLNEKSNQLARILIDKGIKNDSVVAILLERSIDMLISILGVLKAGGAYLPIDISYPKDRISYLLNNSDANVILTNSSFISKVEEKTQIILLDDKDNWDKEVKNLSIQRDVNSLAYIIYTSGSTGNPKGAMVENIGMVNHIFAKINELKITENSVISQNSSHCFDISVWQFLTSLIVGGKTIIYTNDVVLKPTEFIKEIIENKVTILEVVPSYLSVILDILEHEKLEIGCLQYIVVTGETLTTSLVRRWFERYPNVRMVNAYGPTEASDDITHYIMDKYPEIDSIPIGKPIQNFNIYIVDKNMKICPIGVKGEICVAGLGVGRGYIKDEEKTNAVFMEDPFNIKTGVRLYKTGDLGRYKEDGTIEFFGRKDYQVKIRGYRIELGEIENSLVKHEKIKQGAVVVKEDKNGNKYLVGYVEVEGNLEISELRQHLLKNLPEYMVPQYFVQLDKMPLSANGKIDRKSLPDPSENGGMGKNYEAPQNEMEEKLANIWRAVLGGECIGRNDNFFELGGHSLKAISIIGKIHKDFNVELSLTELFKYPTISELAKVINESQKSIYASIELAEEKENYLLSPAQRRMYTIQQLDENNTSYNMPNTLIIEGNLDISRLENAFKMLVARHEALRTSFEIVDEQAVQKIKAFVDCKVEYSKIKEEDIENEIGRFIKPFDLSKAPLLRVKVANIKQDKNVLMMDMHHIISDGLSITLLIKDLMALYQNNSLPNLELQYKDYSEWQNKLIKSKEIEQQETYWVEQFSGEVPVLSLPTDYSRPAVQSFRGNKIILEISKELTNKIREIARQTETTTNMVLLTAYNILLSKYSGQEDIIIGTPISGRNHVDLENIIGMFVNTLVMRNYPKEDMSLMEFLYAVKSTSLKAYQNQDYQFEHLLEKIDFKRDLSRNPLFNVMFTMHNLDYEKIELEDLVINYYEFNDVVSKFDMTLGALEEEEKIILNMEYCTELFKKETINRLLNHFILILDVMVNNTNIKIKDINMLSENEKKQILIDFNNTNFQYMKNKTIHEIFEEQVEKSPEDIAVLFNEDKLTYRELNEKSNKVARLLRDRGVVAGTIVGIMMERSLDMMVGILGILKSGAAYLPIDPDYPDNRIDYIIEDSGINIILTYGKLDSKIDSSEVLTINLDKQSISNYDISNLENINSSRDLAYVIYTSGSTGKPKGTMIEHCSVINRLNWMQKMYPISSNDTILQKTPFTFDVSVWELFWWSFTGAKVCFIVPQGHKEPDVIAEYIERNHITTIHFVPSMLTMFLDCVENNNLTDKLTSLKRVFSSGEALSVKQVNRFNKILNETNGTKLYNLYGPTEATVDVSYFECSGKGHLEMVPIGKPIDNIKLYIMDRNNNLQPIGVPGELCIAGDGLARGYLNKEQLTREKFINNPFEDGGRMYKTGDIAKWLPDGNIEYIGRVDEQIKIRGNRIELGEIETALLKNNTIKECAVIAKENAEGTKYLCAYYVSDIRINTSDFRRSLSKDLPSYMIPAYFIKLDVMPLTANSKINRKLLKDLQEELDDTVEYIPPRNEVEKILTEVWKEVLGGDKVGVLNNFFDLGGDSIKAIQVCSRLHKFNLKLEVKDLLQNFTIDEVAKYVVESDGMKISNDSVEGKVELAPIQKWFFENKFINMNHWNQSVMLYKKDGFDEEKVKIVISEIVKHHDALRMKYNFNDQEIIQYNRGINDERLYDLEVINLEKDKDYNESILKESNRIQSSLNISEGQLVKLAIFKTNDGDNLLITIHHLVVDGVSWRIILEDFISLYMQVNENKEIKLQDKTSSYKEWTNELKKYANSREIKKYKKYWCKAIPKQDILKVDNIVEYRKVKDIDYHQIGISKVYTDKLLKEVNKSYNTEINDILISALVLAINEWSSIENIVINMEGHGREAIVKNINMNRTVGWFTSMYPVFIKITENYTISYIIKYVKEIMRNIPNKGVDYQILKYLSDDNCLNGVEFKNEITFNYLGQFNQCINNEIFSISSIDTGNSVCIDNENLSKLNINGMILNDELNFSIGYDKNEYSSSTIKKFSDIFEIKLKKIIDHCVEKCEREITPYDIGAKNLTLWEFDELCSLYGKENIQKIYDLSPMQQGILFHNVKSSDSYAYFEQISICAEDDVDIRSVEESFNILLERYSILRTNIVYENLNNPRQIVSKYNKKKIYFKDISYMTDSNKKKYVEEFKGKDKVKGFNLQNDSLIRLSILKLESRKYLMVWSFHHIIMDGWCNSIVFNEFINIYKSIINNEKISLSKVYEYKNYIDWLDTQDKDMAKEYWQNYLFEYENVASIPEIKMDTENKSYLSDEVICKIDEEILTKLKKLAIKNKVTLNTMVQTIWGVLLQKYNNTRDVVFGSVVSGRPEELEDVENMIGLFINTIPVRIKLEENDTFKNLVNKTQKDSIISSKYSYYPLPEIQSNTILKDNLINHIIVFENYPIDEGQKENIGINIADNGIDVFEQTNYNFNIMVLPGAEMAIKFMFNANIYDKAFVESIANHFKLVMNTVIDNEDIKISDIDIITQSEKDQILNKFNDTKVKYSFDRTAHELFEQQVEKTPNSVAVIFKDTNVTYRELNERSNKLARALRKKGVGVNDIVGIMLERSVDMIVGILAILKSGAAYLPIDPKYPRNRIKYIIKDSEINVLLTESELVNSIGIDGIVVDIKDEAIYKEDSSNLNNITTSENLAYIIYTSGSTGNPKGVMIEHRGLLNLSILFSQKIGINEKDRILQFASCSFDASVWEIFMSLFVGATIVIPTRDIISEHEKLQTFINDNQITIATLPPTYLVNLDVDNISTLRILVTAGSEAFVDSINLWKEKVQYINAYGPTEDTVCATICKYDRNSNKVNRVSIGKPIVNNKIYILSNENKLQPIGVLGELCIAGHGLARGYLNNSKLTEDKFIDNPLESGTKLYKTGDLARWLPDGNIEFLGRIDNQVKIRGFRIELGEIENKLLSYKNIKEVAVKVIETRKADKLICAYIVSEKEIDNLELKNYLKESLPDYMIPSYFMQLNKLPMTSNGKIDKRLLPDFSFDEMLIGYEEPKNDIEKTLVKIWSEVLELNKIGINDNFFEIGGHSLKAMMLTSKIKKDMGKEITLKELFNSPTIKSLSKFVEEAEVGIYSNIKRIEERPYYELSSPQKRMYMLQNFDKENIAYNMPQIFEIEGDFDKTKIEEIFSVLVERHEALKTYFEVIEDRIVQKIDKKYKFKLQEITDEKDIDEIVSSFIKPFDLGKAPLFRAEVVKNLDKNYLLIDMHHIVSDGVSMSILINEFEDLYNGKQLEPLTIQYKDFAQWQNNMLHSKEISNQEKYWIEMFKEDAPTLILPYDYERPQTKSFDGETIRFIVDNKLTMILRGLSTSTESTMHMILLSAFNILLSKYSGQDDIVIGIPISGRLHPDLKNVMGVFINTLPIRSRLSQSMTYEEFLKEVRETSLRAYENQNYPIEFLVEKLNLKRVKNRNVLFDVMFNTLNMQSNDIDLNGLILKPYVNGKDIAKFDLNLTFTEHKDSLELDLTYCTKLFNRETIEIMRDDFIEILKVIANDKRIFLRDIINKELDEDINNELYLEDFDNEFLINFD